MLDNLQKILLELKSDWKDKLLDFRGKIIPYLIGIFLLIFLMLLRFAIIAYLPKVLRRFF